MWVVKVYYGEFTEATWTPKKYLCGGVHHYKKLKYALEDVMNHDSDIYDTLPEEHSIKDKKCYTEAASNGDDFIFRYENGVTVYLARPFIEDNV